MDPSEHILKFSLQSALFSSCMAMRILSSMLWFAICIFKALKCEAVNLSRIHSAVANGRQIFNFWCAMKSQGWLACLHVHAAQCMHGVIACVITHDMTWHYSDCADKLGPTIHAHDVE